MIRQVGVKELQAIVALVHDCQVAFLVHCHAERPLELAGSGALLTYLRQVFSLQIEYLDPMITWKESNISISITC